MGKIRFDYVGYKDGTFVPFRCQTEKSIEDYNNTSEEQVRKGLCALHKVGNGFGGCSVALNIDSTERWRKIGWLKRNHYTFTMEAEMVNTEDHNLARRYLNKRLDYPEWGGWDTSENCGDGMSCDLGFCD